MTDPRMSLTLKQMQIFRPGWTVREAPSNVLFDVPPIREWLHALKPGEFAEKSPGGKWLIWTKDHPK